MNHLKHFIVLPNPLGHELTWLLYFLLYTTILHYVLAMVNEIVLRLINGIYFQSHIRNVPLPLLSTRFLYIANGGFTNPVSNIVGGNKIPLSYSNISLAFTI